MLLNKRKRNKNICARENRMKQLVRTPFLGPRPRVFPPPGVRFCTKTTKNRNNDWAYHRQPSNKGF